MSGRPKISLRRSSSRKIDNYCLALRRFLVAHPVVNFEPIEQCRLSWIEPERFHLLDEPVAPLRIIVGICRRDLVAPAFDFIRRFLLAIGIQPLRHLLVARAALDLRLEIRAFYSLKPEEHIIERTIEMVFADR